MSTSLRSVVAAELVGRVLAGALGWLLALVGVLCVGYTILRALGPAPWSTLGFTMALTVSLAIVAVGLYGNPELRERLHGRIG